MDALSLPIGSPILESQPFSLPALRQGLADTCTASGDFTGFASIAADDSLFLLFFFQSRPYAAGKIGGDRPQSLTIHGLIDELRLLPYAGPQFSLAATDPVLLKSLLIYLQDPPTAKAPSNLINLEAVLDQIRAEAADALIVLQKGRLLNLFFFKQGTKGKAYLADREFQQDQGLSIDEQMLVYAFQGGAEPVEALVYRTIATREAVDQVSLDDLLGLLGEVRGEHIGVSTEALTMADVVEDELALEVTEGGQKGQTLAAVLPCVIGRKDCDILIADPMVSKQHASLQLVNGRLLLMDLSSTNGTWINGERVTQHPLQEGDVIRMGGTTLKVLRCSKAKG